WLLNQDILNGVKVAMELLKKNISDLRVPIRVKHNLTIMLTGIMLFGKLAEELGLKLPKLDFAASLRQLAGEDNGSFEPKNAVDRFMLHLEAMTHAGDIRQGVDYVLDDKTQCLYFHTNVVIAEHAKWCKVRGLEQEMINDRSLRVMLSEDPSKYVLKAYGFVKRIGNSIPRTTVIHAGKLEGVLGIPITTWMDNQQRNFASAVGDGIG
nr:hypothetical protein [Desulfotomaculaceae bacterium]